MKKIFHFIIATLFMLLVPLIGQGEADRFDDCVLQFEKDAVTPEALAAVKKACLYKHIQKAGNRYDSCILKNIKNSTTTVALRALEDACAKLYLRNGGKIYLLTRSELSKVMIEKIDLLSDTEMEGTLYNGNRRTYVEDIYLEIVFPTDSPIKTLIFHVELNTTPLTFKTFTLDIRAGYYLKKYLKDAKIFVTKGLGRQTR